VKATGGNTPLPSISVASSLSSEVGELTKRMMKGTTRKDQPELKAVCLARDNNRCAISGAVDISYMDHVNDVEKKRLCRTQYAHIIPFSMGKVVEKNVSNTYV
jgi:hypothetical protein